jgi:hypothetical protein
MTVLDNTASIWYYGGYIKWLTKGQKRASMLVMVVMALTLPAHGNPKKERYAADEWVD